MLRFDLLRDLPATRALARAAEAERYAGSRGPWILAFSGGPDSLALALALVAAGEWDLHLLHVDHALDPGSAARSVHAATLAATLDLPFTAVCRSVAAERRRGENLEAAARRVRYDALDRYRAACGAERVLTAHHRDDQAETVLLRLLSGSGLFGLAGIRERAGALWRPALPLGREELAAIVEASGLVPNRDPSNADLARTRNRIRLSLLPHLERRDPELARALAALATRVASIRERLADRIATLSDLRAGAGGASLDRARLLELPEPVALLALQLLEERGGRAAPSSLAARRELLRQLAMANRGRVSLARDHRRPAPRAPFSYTLEAPGEVAIPELGGRLRLVRGAVEPWMRRGEADRAAFQLPTVPCPRFEVRNRRPGDRLRPLGAPGMRTLKRLLIDRKVPRHERDAIPLLVVDGRIAWVRGVTIEHAFRLGDESACWRVEWLPDARPAGAAERSTLEADRDRLPEEGTP